MVESFRVSDKSVRRMPRLYLSIAKSRIGASITSVGLVLNRQLWVWPIIAVVLLASAGYGAGSANSRILNANLESQLQTLRGVETSVRHTLSQDQQSTTETCVLAVPGKIDDVRTRLLKPINAHPRLLLTRDQQETQLEKINSDPLLRETLAHVSSVADQLLTVKPVERVLVGLRLMDVSRTCLKRVVYLSTAYRLTTNKAYAVRAQQEMLAAASFSDWNPAIYLDVAEMTAALAIGYDWTYDSLTPDARVVIRDAIIQKGLKPSIAKRQSFVDATTNWNQVCHGGLTLGALAVLEDEPELAAFILQRAVDNLPTAMAEYAPDGAYPEGPGYWDFGTTYNVLAIAAMESALGTDFGLTKEKAFLDSAEYYLHVVGPTQQYFNYSDCGPRGEVAPAMYWFASRQNNSSLLWNERELLTTFLTAKHNAADFRNRMLPLLLIWASPLQTIGVPQNLNWSANGKTPIGVHRSEWKDRNDTYVGLKGGSPSTPHAHMDIGTFVLDAHAVRWAEDLGMQDYNGLESKGIKIWDNSQAGQRWNVFRNNNLSHNTLVVNGMKQVVGGNARIIGFSDRQPMPHTIIEMTSCYKDQLASAKRGMGMRADRSVLIQDEITVPGQPTTVRWGMVTRANIRVDTPRAATLELFNRRISLNVLSPADARLEVIPTNTPGNEYDAPNPGTRMIAFSVNLPASAKQTIVVLVRTGTLAGVDPEIRQLADW